MTGERVFELLRRGAVGVVVREQRFLVIRRSRFVSAPRTFCFPGGHIETGESEELALQRELWEELGCVVRPLRRLWQNVSARRVQLHWWLAEITTDDPLRPRAEEVESVHWLTSAEMLALPELLDSNRQFLAAWMGGEFAIDGLER